MICCHHQWYSSPLLPTWRNLLGNSHSKTEPQCEGSGICRETLIVIQKLRVMPLYKPTLLAGPQCKVLDEYFGTSVGLLLTNSIPSMLFVPQIHDYLRLSRPSRRYRSSLSSLLLRGERLRLRSRSASVFADARSALPSRGRLSRPVDPDLDLYRRLR